MLPVRNRVRNRAEYAQVNRGGRRARSGPLVVHSLLVDNSGSAGPTAPPPPRVGFVVGRKVGNAVVRNRVRRRLREQARARLDRLPPGALVIIRALPDSALASSKELGRALDAALRSGPASAPGTSASGDATEPRSHRLWPSGSVGATQGGRESQSLRSRPSGRRAR